MFYTTVSTYVDYKIIIKLLNNFYLHLSEIKYQLMLFANLELLFSN